MSIIKAGNAQLFLFLNAFLWGSTYVWSKMLLDTLPRFSILFICSFAGLIATFTLFFPNIKKIKKSDILPSLAVSSFSVLSNTFCMAALQYTASSNTAFIVQMSVLITPVLMSLLDRKLPGKSTVVGALTAIAGLFLITCNPKELHLNIGDLFALCNAVMFSLFLVGQKRISGSVEPVNFTFLHYAFNTLVFLIMASIMEFRQIDYGRIMSPDFIVPAAASMLIAPATILFQSAAIKFVRPEKATLIYTFEPVTAAVLAFLVMGEQQGGVRWFIGCILVLLAVVISEIRLKTLPKPLSRDKISRKDRFSKVKTERGYT